MEFLGGQWGVQSVYKYYKNDKDPSKSDAILYFSNASPAIPSGNHTSKVVPYILLLAALDGKHNGDLVKSGAIAPAVLHKSSNSR